MSLIKFLLIDATLIIIGIPLLVNLQRGRNKLPLLRNLNSDIVFISVWKKESDKEDNLASSLLRLFQATLELKEDLTQENTERYDITNSIQFGSLLIRFIGSGELKGSQPLLPFYFKTIELKLGSTVLLSRSIQIPDIKNRPFFGLISIEENRKWLAARGKGGGLALRLKN